MEKNGKVIIVDDEGDGDYTIHQAVENASEEDIIEVVL